jgi:hypothetical protein
VQENSNDFLSFTDCSLLIVSVLNVLIKINNQNLPLRWQVLPSGKDLGWAAICIKFQETTKVLGLIL